jgi:hypothetical protein
MLQQLMKVQGFAGTGLAIMRVSYAILVNMFDPSFYSNLAVAMKPELERPRVQANLGDLLADEKLQLIGWRESMHSSILAPDHFDHIRHFPEHSTHVRGHVGRDLIVL